MFSPTQPNVASVTADASPVGAAARPARVDELDGLRGLLAMWVVVSHIVCICGLHAARHPRFLDAIWTDVFFAGPAVECFMILSGFAIACLLDGKTISYRGYLSARFFRIYPLYAVSLLGGLGAIFATTFVLGHAQWRNCEYFGWIGTHLANTENFLGTHLLMHATLLHGLPPKWVLPDSASAILGPAWSVGLEWQFYLVAPLLLRWSRSAMGILALAAVSYYAMRHAEPWDNPHLAFLPAQLPFFLIGIASHSFYAWVTRTKDRPRTGLALAVAGLLGGILLVHWHPVALAIWVIVLGGVLVREDHLLARGLAVVRGTLLHPWLQTLGRWSYSLYLIHFPLLFALLGAAIWFHPSLTAREALMILLGVGLPAIILLAAMTYRWVEMPGIRWGRELARRWG